MNTFSLQKRHEIRKQIEIQLFVKEHVQGSQYKLLRFFYNKKVRIYLRLLLYNAYVTFTSSKNFFRIQLSKQDGN